MPKKTIILTHERPDWADEYAQTLATMFPEADFRTAHSMDAAMDHAPEAHAIVGIGPKMPAALIAAMPNLEWIMSLTTGVDALLHMEELPKGLPISRVSGVHGPQMSELALTFMLSLARDMPAFLDNQRAHKWERPPQPLLYGKTLCILGLGSIAETLASYVKPLGMTVTGISDGRTEAPNVDRIYPRAQLLDAAAEADFLVVLVPLTEATRNIVGAEVLAAMKPSAFLINLARGGCVDEAALIGALQTGQIAGAGLDVFEREPLPQDDPVWDAPNLILTPHIGGLADIYHKQCLPTVIENLKVYLTDGAGALKGTTSR